VREGIHGQEAGSCEGQSMGKDDPIEEDRLPVPPNDQVMNSNRGGYSHQRCEESKDAEYRSCNRQMECLMMNSDDGCNSQL
jgi:hypothetical protein